MMRNTGCAGASWVLAGCLVLAGCGKDEATPATEVVNETVTEVGAEVVNETTNETVDEVGVEVANETVDEVAETVDEVSDTTDETTDTSPPPVPRKLVTYHVFGTLPLSNRVVDPLFDAGSRLWALGDNGLVQIPDAVMARVVLSDSPTGTPMVTPDPLPDGGPVALMGEAVFGGTPFQASIWLGRDAVAPQSTCADVFPRTDNSGVVLGGPTAPAGDFEFVYLDCNEDSRVELGGRTWWRFETAGDGFLGDSLFIVQDPVATRFYVAGPVITESDANLHALSTMHRGFTRPATAAERRGIAATLAAMHAQVPGPQRVPGAGPPLLPR